MATQMLSLTILQETYDHPNYGCCTNEHCEYDAKTIIKIIDLSPHHNIFLLREFLNTDIVTSIAKLYYELKIHNFFYGKKIIISNNLDIMQKSFLFLEIDYDELLIIGKAPQFEFHTGYCCRDSEEPCHDYRLTIQQVKINQLISYIN
jgi:hypothetical protein